MYRTVQEISWLGKLLLASEESFIGVTGIWKLSNVLQSHLEIVMRGMKDYISDQNREVIENAIHTLKEELDFDAAAISQLHFAIYLFQESVSILLFLK